LSSPDAVIVPVENILHGGDLKRESRDRQALERHRRLEVVLV